MERALPIVLVAGRPNVGKSRLFNRLAGRNLALVADQPGLTRDRREVEVRLAGRDVILADTAGLEETAPESLAGRMLAATGGALAGADLVLFVIDARAGVTAADEHFARWLRRLGRKVLVVANKAEGRGGAVAALEAHALGFGAPIAVSAEHGEGVGTLMDAVADALPAPAEPPATAGAAEPERPIRLAIVGRPNAGKSTLLNRLLGEERVLTGPEPGITRDPVSALLRADEGAGFELIDTAGLRRRSKVEEGVERLAAGAALETLRMAEIVAVVVDSAEGLHDQDLTLARLVEREGRGIVLVLNKWDEVADRSATRRAIGERLETSLAQLRGIAVVPLSALTGTGVAGLLPAVRAAHAVWNRRVPTAALNRWFEEALAAHPPPLVGGRRLKLRYITEAKARPPTFLVFGTRAEATPEDYRRYLVNGLRQSFDLPGTPIRLGFRGTVNPYAETAG